jgi:dihydrofolate synthase/folylpolyglutamate synthase
VTQFEAAIATSFVAFEQAGVDVAVIEAGLGGRLDATNVIASTATALTSVGLDHVEWLGDSEEEIATEKLAVLRTGTTLVMGDLEPAIAELARATAAERRARLVVPDQIAASELPVGMAPFLRRNAAVARVLAETLAGPIPAERVAPAVAAAGIHGRAELLDGDPPVIADAAHNAAGARALAEAIPGLARSRPVIGCLSVLADKDASGIAVALAPSLDHAVCTAADPGPAMGRPGARSHDPEGLARAITATGVDAEVVTDPAAAIDRARELARARGGVALVAGSHYLLRYLWNARNAQSSCR